MHRPQDRLRGRFATRMHRPDRVEAVHHGPDSQGPQLTCVVGALVRLGAAASLSIGMITDQDHVTHLSLSTEATPRITRRHGAA